MFLLIRCHGLLLTPVCDANRNANSLGLAEVPAVTITDLDEANLRMLRLALNRLSEDARWDVDGLRLEFSDIMEISGELDLRVAGFEMGEIDVAFEDSGGDAKRTTCRRRTRPRCR